MRSNAEALDAIRLMPDILRPEPAFDLSVRLFGQDYALPIGSRRWACRG